MPDVGESDAKFGQAVLEAAERRGGARVYDRRLGTVDPIGRDRPTKTEVNDVDRHNGHRCSVPWGRRNPLYSFNRLLPFLHGNKVALCAPHEDLPGA